MTFERNSNVSANRPLWVVHFDAPQPYRPLWDLQRELWSARHAGEIPDVLLLLEHTPVITLGRNSRREHLLFSDETYLERGVDVVSVDRGGDVTFHGPGQLVGYWIFDLKQLYPDVHRYLREIEETLIRTVAEFGVTGQRSAGATGVWAEDESGALSKVAAIGLHLSHWVSTHGFALNLSNDLAAFDGIVPCGLHGRGVTSLSRLIEPNAAPSRTEVEAALVEQTTRIFPREALWLTPEDLQLRVRERDHARVA